MKHTCVECNKQFKLYYNFRKHLQTNQHAKKSYTTFSQEELEKLDKNRQILLNFIRSG
jgi:hypothetical protein